MNDIKASITIIGYGRVGKLLHKSLKHAGYDHILVLTRQDKILSLNELILISVPDNNIQSVVYDIKNSGLDLETKTLAHTSGVVGLDVFSVLNQHKIKVGCLHPCMAISDTSQSFQGITFDICGDKDFINTISLLIADLNAEPMIVEEHTKAKLHLAAVISSNYLITLMGMAQELFANSNLDQNQLKKTLLTLMRSVLVNLETQTTIEALTGPISRGDYETITRHLHLLKDQPELKSTYKKLGDETLRLFGSSLDNKVLSILNKIFTEG